MRAGRTFNNLIAVILLIAATLLAIYSGVGVSYAATTRYSDVLDDLRKDNTFNVADYPALNTDYRLELIQIAESTDGELFVYVYQPAARAKMLAATSVNMSLAETKDGAQLYKLTMLNNAGVFQKYRIEGVNVSSEEIRYYNITSIYRDFIKDIDKPTGNDNVINSVCYEVGKLYKAETIDGAINYDCKITDVVEIENPYVDFISYYDGLTWANYLGIMTSKYTDIHYIAFSTNREIDTLKEADVTYKTQSYTSGRDTSYGSLSESKYTTLTGETSVSAVGYTWKSILRSEDFINSTKLNDTTKSIVSKSEFVLVFLTTSYTERSASDFVGHYTKKTGTKVSNVSILRLEFETDGKVYNLGTIMNQQEGDDIPGNQEKPIGFWAYIWRCIVRLFTGTATLSEQIVAVIVILIVLVILPIAIFVLSIVFPAFRAVLKTTFKALLCLLKGLWWLISLPFRGIAALIRKRQEAAPAKATRAKAPKSKPRASRSRTRSTSKTKSSTTRKTGGKSK